MKWLQDNPVAVALAGASGLLLLLLLLMAIVWTLPVRVDIEVAQTKAGKTKAQGAAKVEPTAARELDALESYLVINEKPVFNENRRPLLAEDIADESPSQDSSIAVRDAPDVRLTGVIITPALRMASLTPAGGGKKSVMAYEGQSLVGEYVGWQLATVQPRNVVLASTDGQSMQLELEVHDAKIKEPPKPVVAQNAAPEGSDQPAAADGEGEQPLSRAEQIRQRIAERREELRREQEQKQAQGTKTTSNDGGRARKTADYRDAIRAMMGNKSKDKGSHDKEDS